MTNLWQVLMTVAVGITVFWLLSVAALYVLGRRYEDPTRLPDALRLIPDVVRLLRRLSSDRSLSRGVRVRIVLLLVYLALPVDLVPDFIPVVGYSDDVIIVAIVLRSVTRQAGVEALERHWPGSPEGLRAIKRLAGVTDVEKT